MKTKEERIAELQKQIEEIKNEKPMNYKLVEVVPDCGAGISDKRTTIAISPDSTKLIDYCMNEFNYSPPVCHEKYSRPNDGLPPCTTWYRIELTKVQIV